MLANLADWRTLHGGLGGLELDGLGGLADSGLADSGRAPADSGGLPAGSGSLWRISVWRSPWGEE